MTSSSAFQAVLVDQPDEDLSFLPETCWRTGSDGRWFDPEWLYESLRNGSVKLSDDFLQMQFLDYIEKQERCEFYNTMNSITLPLPNVETSPMQSRRGRFVTRLSRPCPRFASMSLFPDSEI